MNNLEALLNSLGGIAGNPLEAGFRDIVIPRNDPTTDNYHNGTAPLAAQCPGISTPRHKVMRWCVPRDSSLNTTYCSACAAKYGLVDLAMVQGTGAYCHGYLKGNTADNEVFNVSFWDDTKRSYFSTEKIDPDDDSSYLVDLPHGEDFSILVTYLNPKEDQYFRCSLIQDVDGQERIIIPESKTFSQHTCLITSKHMCYVDSSISTKFFPKGVFGPGSNLMIKINIYDRAQRTFNGLSGCDLGTFRWDASKQLMIPSANGEVPFARSASVFNDKVTRHMPIDKFTKFTKNPLVMNFILTTDPTSNSAQSWKKVESLLERALLVRKKACNSLQSRSRAARDDIEKRKVTLELLDQRCEEVSAHVSEIQSILRENEQLKPISEDVEPESEDDEGGEGNEGFTFNPIPELPID